MGGGGGATQHRVARGPSAIGPQTPAAPVRTSPVSIPPPGLPQPPGVLLQNNGSLLGLMVTMKSMLLLWLHCEDTLDVVNQQRSGTWKRPWTLDEQWSAYIYQIRGMKTSEASVVLAHMT